MSKEAKFYIALTLIGVCVACAVYFYFNIEQSEMVDAYKRHGRGRVRGESYTTPKAVKYYNDKDYIIYMCLSLIPIIPLFFFAKNNSPNK